jgi:trigger factor
MSYRIEILSSTERQVTVQVPREEVDIAIDTIIGVKRESVDKKGFRKDRVPDSQIFNDQKAEILAQATRQIFDVRVKEAQRLYGINPINRVQVQSDGPLTRGEAFGFQFIAEILPDLDIPDFKNRVVDVKRVEVSDADIDTIIASLREQLSMLEPINEIRKPIDGDVVSFDFESRGQFKSVMGMSGTGHKLELGTGNTIAEFESIIKSLMPGESKTAPVTYPSEFPNPNLAGKQVETKVVLKTLNRKTLPAIDAKFAQRVARVSTVTEMRDIIRQRHNHRLAQLYRQEAQRRLLDDILLDVEVPLSSCYVEQNLEEMIGSYTMAMQQRGMTTEEISGLIGQKKLEYLPEAEAAARRQLFLLAVAKREQLKLDKQEVEAVIARQAEAAETEPAQFLIDAQQSGLIRHIKDNLMMRKVVNYIYDNAEKRIVDAAGAR